MDTHIVKFVQRNVVGIIATSTKDQPHASPVYYLYDEKEKCFYFVTKDITRKYGDISKNDQVTITIYNESPQVVFSAECKADIVKVDEPNYMVKIDQLVRIHTNQQYWPTPIDKMSDGEIVLICLRVKASTFRSYQKSNVTL